MHVSSLISSFFENYFFFEKESKSTINISQGQILEI